MEKRFLSVERAHKFRCRLKLFLPLSFYLKDLLGGSTIACTTTFVFVFSIARSVRVISTAQL